MNFIYKLVLATVLDAFIILTGLFLWGIYTFHQTYDYDYVNDIYRHVLAQTGQVQDGIPLEIVEQPTVNAFNDGQRIVIYRGMLDFVENDDELALVLGHEIAHGMLRHLAYHEFLSSANETSVAEGNADKMGAVYMMKAGYDVCSGREMWNRLRLDKGNYQGADHPNYSYRYDELNINCGD